MSRKRYQELEEENEELIEQNKKLRDMYNELIADQGNRSLVYPTILTVVLLASALNILSRQENFNFINLSLFIVPNIIELINLPNQHKIISNFRWGIVVFLCLIYCLLFASTFGNFIVDSGVAFSVTSTALAFKGLYVIKENLVAFVFINVCVPFLSHAARNNKGYKNLTDYAIETYTAITSKGGKQNNV